MTTSVAALNKFLTILCILWLSISGPEVAWSAVKKPLPKHQTLRLKEDHSVLTAPKFGKLRDKYDSSDFDYEVRAKTDSAWSRFIEWLRDFFGVNNGKSSGNSVLWLQRIGGVLIFLFVVFLIVKSIMNKEGRWIFGKSAARRIIRNEDAETDLQAIDFEQRIRETRLAGNNRLAVRYYYLWLLQLLSAQNHIEWDPEKTNSDYQRELKNPELARDFAYLSYLYDYIWYGEFDLDETMVNKAESAFAKTIKSLRS